MSSGGWVGAGDLIDMGTALGTNCSVLDLCIRRAAIPTGTLAHHGKCSVLHTKPLDCAEYMTCLARFLRAFTPPILSMI